MKAMRMTTTNVDLRKSAQGRGMTRAGLVASARREPSFDGAPLLDRNTSAFGKSRSRMRPSRLATPVDRHDFRAFQIRESP